MVLVKTLCHSLYSIQFNAYLKDSESSFMWAGNAGGGRLNCWSSSSAAGLLLGPTKPPPRLPEWKEAESINAAEEKTKK